MGKDHATFHCNRVVETCEFLHEELIRQTVEDIAVDTHRLVAPRDRQ